MPIFFQLLFLDDATLPDEAKTISLLLLMLFSFSKIWISCWMIVLYCLIIILESYFGESWLEKPTEGVKYFAISFIAWLYSDIHLWENKSFYFLH